MALKPWHTLVTPREDLRSGRPLDASEFAVHLDHVRDGAAPQVYQNPRAFFERTFLTQNLSALAVEVVRRLSGIQTETNAVFNLATQFGGGKTHALTLLYHLASHGVTHQTDWPGVASIISRAGVAGLQPAAIAVFVGTEFDSLTGRGGSDGTPLRKTPWGEIAYQLTGDQGLAIVAEHERQGTAPGGDVLHAVLPTDRPVLILMDELLNFVSRSRLSGLAGQLYSFLQNLSETARSMRNVVLAVSIPASELEMTPEDHEDYERFRKLLDRVGRAYMLSGETETSEIIRRRLFEWDLRSIGQEGRVNLPREALAVCNEYAQWVIAHRQQLPQWFPLDTAATSFRLTYPFHPSVLSVFERKWRTLPRFQQTRGVLRVLALWVAHAYTDSYRRAYRDPMIGLGTAPLDDTLFRAAVFEQLGESRLEGVITTDICGKPESHATRLDNDATEVLRQARLHRKVAASIFFESHGGTTSRAYATVPEIRLAVAEPDLDIGNIETALEALAASCYYLTAESNQYRFSLTPNLNKLLADRRGTIQQSDIARRVREVIEETFRSNAAGIERIFFPEKSNDIPDRATLTLAIVAPEMASSPDFQVSLEAMTREYGGSSRQYKNALIWCVPEGITGMYDEARKSLAWDSIDTDRDLPRGDDGNATRQHLDESRGRAKRDLQASVWRSYRKLLLLNNENLLKPIDLGQMNASGGSLVNQIVQQLQQLDELTTKVGAGFLVRNWPPAFTEWSTRNVRDTFYASPRYPRLLRSDTLAETIAQGVNDGVIAYVIKGSGGEYAQFHFKDPQFSVMNVDISEDTYIITTAMAQAYLDGRPQSSVNQTTPEDTWDGAQPDSGLPYPEQFGSSQPLADPPYDGAQPQNATVPAMTSTRLIWNGTIPSQKWMNFYTRVLSGLVNAGELRLALTIEASPNNGLTHQQVEAIKAALRDLGLPDNIQVD